MRFNSIILFLCVLTFSLTVSAQSERRTNKPDPRPKDNIVVTVNDEDITSELLPIPIQPGPRLTRAQFGALYFGPKSGSDISVILILNGTKGRYSEGEFAVRILVNDIPLKSNTLRAVMRVIQMDDGGETLNLHVNEEELAWMASAKTLQISIYNLVTREKYDWVTFTPKALANFKRFADSVLLIRSNSK